MVKYDDLGFITELCPHEVFVFGSNLEGKHQAGAAKTACEKFGAIWGQGEGLQGQSYAIPTMNGPEEMWNSVFHFENFIRLAPNLIFYLTPVGTGIAGYTHETMKKIFDFDSPNLVKPKEWE